jgi:hypothetical protein
MSSQGAIRLALLTAANEPRTDLASEITPLYIDLTSGILLDLLTAINAANGTRHFIDPMDNRDDWYNYTTRNRQWRLGAAADASLSAASEHVTAIDGWRITADTVINQQIATVDEPDFPLAYIKVWDWANLPPLPLTIYAGKPLVTTATYSDYVLSCPDLIIVSSGDPLTTTLAHHGYSSTITLASAGTTVVKAFSVAGRQAVREPSVTHSADDLTSEALPRGIRAGPEISGDFVGAFASAIGISEHMVWRYGTPTKRPSLTVENWLPTQFQIDLFDVISFTSVQLKVSALKFEIVGLTERVDRAPDNLAYHVVTTYQLQEQKVHAMFFTLDVSELDGADELAY